MVVSNSTKINRRAAQENAARQRQERAQSLVDQGQESETIKQVAATGGSNETGFEQTAPKFETPTNDMAPGFNPSSGTFNADGSVNAKQFSEKKGFSGSDEAGNAITQQQKEFDNTKGYRTVVRNGRVSYVEDKEVTATKQLALAQQNTAKAATIANTQDVLNKENKGQESTQTSAEIVVPEISEVDMQQADVYYDSLLSALPEGQQQVLAPILQAMKGEYTANVRAGMTMQQALQAAQANSNKSFKASADFLETIMNEGTALISQNKEAQLAAEAENKEAALRENQLQADIEESKRQRTIRDAVADHEEKEEASLLQHGINKGWRSSRKTASVLKQIRRGEDAIKDMREDALLSERFYSNKKLEIEKDYTNNIKSISQTATNDTIKLLQEIRAKAIELDSNKTLSDNERAIKIAEIESEMMNKRAGIQTRKAELFSNAVSDMYSAQADAKKQIYKEKQDLMDDTWKYLDKYGTQDKKEIQRREQELGLPIGSLSNTKMLKEIKKSGGGAGLNASISGVIGDIDNMYELYLGTGLEPAAAQDAVTQAMYNRYGTSGSGREKYFLSEKYINEKFGRENSYYSSAKKPKSDDAANITAGLKALLSE